MTTNAPTLLGIPNTGGLIAVDTDPLKDIRALKQSKVVIRQ
jgi:hypothetical protein